MDVILYCSLAELEMMVTQSSCVALFNPFHCTEVTQDQPHFAISGCIAEANVCDHAKRRTTHHIQREDTRKG